MPKAKIDFITNTESVVDFGIKSLTLQNFRTYLHKRFAFEEIKSVVITGPNGVGKTNILEAISWLSPGRGLRRVTLLEALNNNLPPENPMGWGVNAAIINDQQMTTVGTGIIRDPYKNDWRRVVHVNQEPIKSITQLNQYLTLQWLTPNMDRLLADSSSDRRQFFDRLVYAFDNSHAKRVSQYELAQRERMRLLKSPFQDSNWLETLEAKMSELSVAIISSRLELLEALNDKTHWVMANFPYCLLSFQGEVENMLQRGDSAAQAEAWLKNEFYKNRAIDTRLGITHCGAHRSDLQVRFADKNDIPVALCSTGEQKICILGIIFAACRLLVLQNKPSPILLLDEVVAHLDHNRRAIMFRALEEMCIQAWMTGTDRAIFEQGKCAAHYVDLL